MRLLLGEILVLMQYPKIPPLHNQFCCGYCSEHLAAMPHPHQLYVWCVVSVSLKDSDYAGVSTDTWGSSHPLRSQYPTRGDVLCAVFMTLISIPGGGIVPGAVTLGQTRPPHSSASLLEATILTIILTTILVMILLPCYWWFWPIILLSFYSHSTDDFNLASTELVTPSVPQL